MSLNTDTMGTQDASSPPVGGDTSGPDGLDCQILESLLRPRYFAGQLLTEAELNSEQAYMLAKQRLHNLYLHGSGVVFGMEVAQQEGTTKVTIEPGYAIDPCGNDIIVPAAYKLDVLHVIREGDNARKNRRQANWKPARVSSPNGEKQYWLTVAYAEKEARPTSTLRQGNTLRSDKGNGCGCNSSQKSTTTTQSSAGQTPIGCEITRIQEDYRFELIEALPGRSEPMGTMWGGTLMTVGNRLVLAQITVKNDTDIEVKNDDAVRWPEPGASPQITALLQLVGELRTVIMTLQGQVVALQSDVEKLKTDQSAIPAPEPSPDQPGPSSPGDGHP